MCVFGGVGGVGVVGGIVLSMPLPVCIRECMLAAGTFDRQEILFSDCLIGRSFKTAV